MGWKVRDDRVLVYEILYWIIKFQKGKIKQKAEGYQVKYYKGKFHGLVGCDYPDKSNTW